jgi:hypothetical protein
LILSTKTKKDNLPFEAKQRTATLKIVKLLISFEEYRSSVARTQGYAGFSASYASKMLTFRVIKITCTFFDLSVSLLISSKLKEWCEVFCPQKIR